MNANRIPACCAALALAQILAADTPLPVDDWTEIRILSTKTNRLSQQELDRSAELIHQFANKKLQGQQSLEFLYHAQRLEPLLKERDGDKGQGDTAPTVAMSRDEQPPRGQSPSELPWDDILRRLLAGLVALTCGYRFIRTVIGRYRS